MKVLIDDNIPYIRSAAQWLLGDVDYLPGHTFGGSRQLAEADALIIRTPPPLHSHRHHRP